MSLYQDAYGFTSLRLFVDVFEGWLGVLVVAGVVAGVVLRGRWLGRFALVTGVTGGVEGSLGTNSAGSSRPNSNPCP